MPRKPASTRLTALIVAAAMFMEMLDGTVLATALPAMARSFHADPLQMSVALTSYLLSLAVFIPPSGKVADRLGAHRLPRRDRAVHAWLDPVRRVAEPAVPGGGPHRCRALAAR